MTDKQSFPIAVKLALGWPWQPAIGIIMGDQLNPYSSPVTSTSQTNGRPVGTTVLAVMLFIGGSWLGAGLIIRTAQHWLTQGLPPLLPVVHLGILSLVALAASIGMMSGRRWGWWAAIATCYVLLASFSLVPAIYNVYNGNTPGGKRAVWGFAMLLYWLYLHKAAVIRYFALSEQRRWIRHLGLFLLCLIAVLTFVEFG